MSEVRDDYQALVAAAAELLLLWEVEHRDAAWPGSGDGPHVSGGGHSRTTETAALRPGRDRHAERVASKLGHFRRRLEDTLADLRPKLTGRQCVVDGCEGAGLTPRGRCPDCDDYAAKHYGITPDQVHSIDANGEAIPGRTLVDDRNDRRPKACVCPVECCPDGCVRWVEPGLGWWHNTCAKRKERAAGRGEEWALRGAWEWREEAS